MNRATNNPSAGAEPFAKAALLEHLRTENCFVGPVSIIQELGISKWANRADIVLVDNEIHCFEIKTKRDTLARLDQQLTAYGSVADRVSVVVATRHMNSVLSRIPDHVGVCELLGGDENLRLEKIRDAGLSPTWDPEKALEFMPAAMLNKFLFGRIKRSSRAELMALARTIPPAQVKRAVRDFLVARYRPTTRTFLSRIKGRSIAPSDLNSLRLWSREGSISYVRSVPCYDDQIDRRLYEQVGISFGPVPEDVAMHFGC